MARRQHDAIERLGQDLRLAAGDLAVTLHCGGDGRPGHVTVQRPDGPLVLDAEHVERLAAIVASARGDALDSRDVCAAHGYYDTPTDHRWPWCPDCRAREQADPPLVGTLLTALAKAVDE